MFVPPITDGLDIVHQIVKKKLHHVEFLLCPPKRRVIRFLHKTLHCKKRKNFHGNIKKNKI